MRYFSPERSKLGNGLPMYVDPSGKGIGPLPVIQVSPYSYFTHSEDSAIEVERIEIAVMLLVNKTTGRLFTKKGFHPMNITGLLEDWLDDPEKVLKETFGYSGLGPDPEEKDATSLLLELGL